MTFPMLENFEVTQWQTDAKRLRLDQDELKEFMLVTEPRLRDLVNASLLLLWDYTPQTFLLLYKLSRVRPPIKGWKGTDRWSLDGGNRPRYYDLGFSPLPDHPVFHILHTSSSISVYVPHVIALGISKQAWPMRRLKIAKKYTGTIDTISRLDLSVPCFREISFTLWVYLFWLSKNSSAKYVFM